MIVSTTAVSGEEACWVCVCETECVSAFLWPTDLCLVVYNPCYQDRPWFLMKNNVLTLWTSNLLQCDKVFVSCSNVETILISSGLRWGFGKSVAGLLVFQFSNDLTKFVPFDEQGYFILLFVYNYQLSEVFNQICYLKSDCMICIFN